MPIETGPKNLGKKAQAQLAADLAAIDAEFAEKEKQKITKAEIGEVELDQAKSNEEQSSPQLILDDKGAGASQQADEEETVKQAAKAEADKKQGDAMESFLQRGGEDTQEKEVQPVEQDPIAVTQKAQAEGIETKAEVAGVGINEEALRSYEEVVEAQKKFLQAKSEGSHLDKIWAKLGSKGNQDHSAKIEAAKQELEAKRVEFRKAFGAFGQGLVNGKKLELEKAGMSSGEIKEKLLGFMQAERIIEVGTGEKDDQENEIKVMRSISEEYNNRLFELDKIQIESLPSKAKAFFKGAWKVYNKIPPKVRFALILSGALGIGVFTGGLATAGAAITGGALSGGAATAVGATAVAGKRIARWGLGGLTGAYTAKKTAQGVESYQQKRDSKLGKTAEDFHKKGADELSVTTNTKLDTEIDSVVEEGLLIGVEKQKKVLDELQQRQKKQLRNRMITAGLVGASTGYGASAFAGGFLDSTMFSGGGHVHENINKPGMGITDKPENVSKPDMKGPVIKHPVVQHAMSGSNPEDIKPELSNRTENNPILSQNVEPDATGIVHGETPQDKVAAAAERARNVANMRTTQEGIEVGIMDSETPPGVIAAAADKVDSALEKVNNKVFTLKTGDSVWKVLKADGMSDRDIMNKVGSFSKQVGQQLMEEKGMTKEQAMAFINGRFSHMDISESFSLDDKGGIKCGSFLSDNKLSQFESGEWKIEQFESPASLLNVEDQHGINHIPSELQGETILSPEEQLKNHIAQQTGFNTEREGFQHAFQKMPESFRGNSDLASAYMKVFAGNQEDIGDGLKNLFGFDQKPVWYMDENGMLVVEDAYGKKDFNLLVKGNSIGVDGPSKYNWGMEHGKLISKEPIAELDIENIGQAREYIEGRSAQQLKLGNADRADQNYEQTVKASMATKADLSEKPQTSVNINGQAAKPEIQQSPAVEKEALERAAVQASSHNIASGSKAVFDKDLLESLKKAEADPLVLDKVNNQKSSDIFNKMLLALDTTENRDTVDDRSYALVLDMAKNDGGERGINFGEYLQRYAENKKEPMSQEDLDALANIYNKFSVESA